MAHCRWPRRADPSRVSGRAQTAAPARRPSKRSADPHRPPVGLTRRWHCGARVSSVAPREGEGMPDVRLAPVANGAASRFVDRRTLLVGAAGALAAAGLSGPARAAGSATSLAARRFDPDLARRLRLALHAALRDPSTQSPGAILRVQSREARPLVGRRRPRSRGAGRTDAPRRSLPRRQHREDVRLRHRAATERARSAVARRPAARGAPRERHRPRCQRGRHHGAHAARPPRRHPGLGRSGARRAGRA